jgi:glycosyltransferase involved in cell wall biosynthesis
MRKRILIDATTVTSQVDGLSHCIINLIKYLPEESFDKFSYTVLINKGVKRNALTNALANPAINVIEEKIAHIGLKREWDMYWFLRKYKKDFDLIHITSNNYPFTLKQGLGTVHDITFKQYFDNPKYTFKLAPMYMDIMIRNALKKSRAMIAVSQATKNDLIKTYSLNERAANKINVVRLGWEHLITEMDAEENGCQQPLAVENDYLLYVGTNRIHKNIANLLLSFKDALRTIPAGKKLVIIGSDKYLKEKDMGIISDINRNGVRVIFTGYLSQACVQRYFRHADAYVFPSLSEGFGLGVLEAFYYDIPLLCSNTSSLPEVAGEAALYFDPFKPSEITAAITKFYADAGLAKTLRAAGRERLKLFSWKKNAVETVAIYEKCLS